jgi:addiction module HigA family antidote
MEFRMAYRAKRNPDRCPTHPGALLREDIIPAVKRSKTEIADLLGVSRHHLHAILAEKKPVTPKVAVLFGTLFCDGPDIWIKMQSAYDLWHAQQTTDVSHIRPLKEAA